MTRFLCGAVVVFVVCVVVCYQCFACVAGHDFAVQVGAVLSCDVHLLIIVLLLLLCT